jgi:hypothetical protein
MSVVFSHEIKAEGGFIVFRVFTSGDGRMAGRKVLVPERSIEDIWPGDEAPLDTGRKYLRIIHRILRDKIEKNEFNVTDNGDFHILL